MDGRYHFIPHDLIYTNRRALAAGSLTEEKGTIYRLMAKTGRAVLASSTQWQFALEAADLCCCLFLPIF